MIVEFHDGDVGDLEKGTLIARIGVKGDVVYTYQAEMWIQEMFLERPRICRAFVISPGVVHSVLKSNNGRKSLYIARRDGYDGEWKLPFEYGTATGVAVVEMRRDTSSAISKCETWAQERLRDANVACAVLIDGDGIVGCWERSPTGVALLTARGPRELKPVAVH